jgi:hypothetical protein
VLRLGTLGGLAVQEAQAMSVYVLAVVRDRPDTRARCSGSGRAVSASWTTRSRWMRSMLTHVAHQRQSHRVTPWLHRRRQVISLAEIISRRLKEDQGDSTATG